MMFVEPADFTGTGLIDDDDDEDEEEEEDDDVEQFGICVPSAV